MADTFASSAPRPAPHIASVTVTFNPDPSRLADQIGALRGQVDDIIVVDNGSDAGIDGPAFAAGTGAPHLIALGENLGVAVGFNIGIREARRRGAQFVLLLDHDSIPAPDMVAELLATYGRGLASGDAPVAAVGPRVNDVRDHLEYPFIRLGWARNRHLRCGTECDHDIACDFLISSGKLIAMEHFEAIGEFDERLFIDSVDLEWCCRARARGYALYGSCPARLDHWLGDDRRELIDGVSLVVHSPQRTYYMTRNRFLLYQRAYMPLKWKLKDALRALAKFSATMLLIPPRLEYLRMTLLAVRDARAGRGGRLAEEGEFTQRPLRLE